jgi:tight adherence protein B
MTVFVFLGGALLIAAVLFFHPAIRVKYVERMNRVQRNTEERIERMFAVLNVSQMGTVQMGFGIGAFVVSNLLLWNVMGINALIPAGLLFVAGLFAPHVIIYIAWSKYRRDFSEQLIDGLTLLGNGLRAGLSLQQSVELVSTQAPNPMAKEMSFVLREHRFGVDLDQAIANCAERMGDDDLKLTAISIKTTYRLGGNLASIFSQVVQMIRERKVLKGKADALTAQGKMQALVVGVMPLVILFLASKSNPELIATFFSGPMGWVALFLMFVLDITGYVWVRKISTIDY